ncbi:hypothetical protein A8C32_00785 [Flavivirga aquatica]|uniref:Glycosyltransferase 2-like domain-containing protein n=1 Tax=Flavivirga aquatica TaxID=1849968 RepID=A0A1E5TBT9_9FLAO|nr:hypothetical protein [Flavivirga aquatica]OEK08844.1 hypothetical protein A8C32_00785 [Flavivirga aquatica]
MALISLIVLSKTDNEDVFKMNLNCFKSFILSAEKANFSYEIILVESNKKVAYNYKVDKLKIVTPNKEFNFHTFLNIGVDNAKGDLYVLSNNDVVYSENWLVELDKVRKLNKEILSFSPYDSKSNKLPKQSIAENDFVLGYDIQKHLTGWCIIADKKVFKSIKKLDERFNFYYADNDYAMKLIKYNIKHALVTKALVQHLEWQSSSNESISKPKGDLPKDTPKYIIRENWTWVLNNRKMIEGLIIFHNKWGSRKIIKIKLLVSKFLLKIGFGFLNRYVVYNN